MHLYKQTKKTHITRTSHHFIVEFSRYTKGIFKNESQTSASQQPSQHKQTKKKTSNIPEHVATNQINPQYSYC